LDDAGSALLKKAMAQLQRSARTFQQIGAFVGDAPWHWLPDSGFIFIIVYYDEWATITCFVIW
jgi:hypothetical protein